MSAVATDLIFVFLTIGGVAGGLAQHLNSGKT
jgi:hypothetical protein